MLDSLATTPKAVAGNGAIARPKMSYAEYLQWADEDTHSEWVDGEVFIFMATKPIHQFTLEFLHLLLRYFVDLFHLGQVHVAPFEALLRSGRSSREPDIFFVAQANLHRISKDRLVGPPDLIVEIVSAESVQRDRLEKFREYQQVGVQEYWVIDPRPGKQRADFFRLNDEGEYDLFGTEDDERVASVVLPGFWLRPDWLWQANTLDPFTVFCEMAGLPESFAAQVRQQLQAGFDTLRGLGD
ncbi:MAG: Uma2 family endonuclease [Chloroflexota bacterium]